VAWKRWVYPLPWPERICGVAPATSTRFKCCLNGYETITNAFEALLFIFDEISGGFFTMCIGDGAVLANDFRPISR